MESADAPDEPTPPARDLAALLVSGEKATDAAFSEAVWEAAIRLYLNTRPALN